MQAEAELAASNFSVESARAAFFPQIQLTGEVVASARRAFEVAEVQLRGGTANLISVLQTQQTLFVAEDNLAQVRLNRFLAATSLFQALGGGWSRELASSSTDRRLLATRP